VTVIGLGVALGVVAGLAARAIPGDLGVAAVPFAGGVIPIIVCAAFLVSGWLVLFAWAGRQRVGPRGILLGVGLLPVAAMLAGGPVAGLYFLLWPSILITPAALVIGSRPSNV
jgi:hypothetical protein